jgi:hypothetical protein
VSAVFFVFRLELPRLEEEEEEESSPAMYSSTFPTLLSSERLRGRTETKREKERKKQLETTKKRRAHTRPDEGCPGLHLVLVRAPGHRMPEAAACEATSQVVVESVSYE